MAHRGTGGVVPNYRRQVNFCFVKFYCKDPTFLLKTTLIENGFQENAQSSGTGKLLRLFLIRLNLSQCFDGFSIVILSPNSHIKL